MMSAATSTGIPRSWMFWRVVMSTTPAFISPTSFGPMIFAYGSTASAYRRISADVTMPFGVRSRIMKRPGVRFERCSSPTHLSRVSMSAFSISFQSSSPARIAAANL